MVEVTVDFGDGSKYVERAVSRDHVTVGREFNGAHEAISSISIEDEGISPRHARLLLADAPGELAVQDLGSRDGTFVDGRRLELGEVCSLGEGGSLMIGHLRAVARLVDRVEPLAFGLRMPLEADVLDEAERRAAASRPR
jgi:hypothetical protein